MIILKDDIVKWSAYFANEILKINQETGKVIVVKSIGDIGIGKTTFNDGMKRFLTNRDSSSQGLTYSSLMCSSFILNEKTYKILHLDASLVGPTNLISKIPFDKDITDTYQFIFIEHPHELAYKDLNEKLKENKKNIIEIEIKISKTNELNSRNFEISSKDYDCEKLLQISNVPLLESTFEEDYIPESDMIDDKTLKKILEKYESCSRKSFTSFLILLTFILFMIYKTFISFIPVEFFIILTIMILTIKLNKNKNYIYIMGIDATCDDGSICVIKIENGKKKIIYNKTKTFEQQNGSIRDYLELGPYIQTVLEEMYSEIPETIKIDFICVSNCPGLPISLQYSMMFAINLARKMKIPIMFLNHVYSHLFAGLNYNTEIKKFSGIVTSGGHFILVTYENNEFKVVWETGTDTMGGTTDKLWKELMTTPQPYGLYCEKAMNEFLEGLNIDELSESKKKDIENILDKIGKIEDMSNIKNKVRTLIFEMLLEPHKEKLLKLYENKFSDYHFEHGVKQILTNKKYKRQETLEEFKQHLSNDSIPLDGRLKGDETSETLFSYLKKYKQQITQREIKKQMNSAAIYNSESNFDTILEEYSNETKEPSLHEFLRKVYTSLPRSKYFVGLLSTIIHILIGRFLENMILKNIEFIKKSGNKLVIGGGCIYNKYYQNISKSLCDKYKIEYIQTPLHLCQDNAEMVIMHALKNIDVISEINNENKLNYAIKYGFRMPSSVVNLDTVQICNWKVTNKEDFKLIS